MGRDSEYDNKQLHLQNQYGEYAFGYSNPTGSKSEIRTSDGTVRGTYQYVDANNILQTVQYVSDKQGFRVVASNLPVIPEAYENQKEETQRPYPQAVPDFMQQKATKIPSTEINSQKNQFQLPPGLSFRDYDDYSYDYTSQASAPLQTDIHNQKNFNSYRMENREPKVISGPYNIEHSTTDIKEKKLTIPPGLSLKSEEDNDYFQVDQGNMEYKEIEPYSNYYDDYYNDESNNSSPVTQFQVQDGKGRYLFGYENLNSKRSEFREDGVVRGSYNYIDSKGKVQTVHYIADSKGFRASGTTIPVANEETDEVKKARMDHLSLVSQWKQKYGMSLTSGH